MEQELQRLRRYNHVAERLNAVGLFRLPHVEITEVNDSNYHVYDPAGPHLSIYGQSGSGAIYNIARQGQVRRVWLRATSTSLSTTGLSLALPAVTEDPSIYAVLESRATKATADKAKAKVQV